MARDRVFFFGDYQGSRQDAPGFGTASVMPEAWRRGDLSSIGAVIRDPQTGLPFPGNQVPTSRFGPIARALFADTASYPLPNRGVSGGVAGNYVGETLLKIRGHQGDARVDWNASASDKLFVRYSFATYEDKRDVNPFALVLPTRNDQPFWNVGGNWNRIFGPTMVNELLVGLQPHHRRLGDLRLGGHRQRQRDLRHRRRPADRRAQSAQHHRRRPDPARRDRPGHRHAGHDLPDQREADLAARPPHAQVRRPVAALRPAALLRRQQRPARVPHLQRLVHGQLRGRLPARPVGGQGAWRRRPGRPVDAPAEPHRVVRPGRLQAPPERDPERRAALGLHLAAGRSRTTGRPTSICRPAQQILASDGGIEDRALYQPYYGGFEPRLGVAWQVERSDRGPRRLRHLAVHGRHRRQPAAAAQPAVLLRVGGGLRHDHRRRQRRQRLQRPRAGDDPGRQRPRLRSRAAAAVLAAVERLRRVSGDLVDVGADRLCRPPRRPPGDPGRRQPGAAGRRRRVDLGVQDDAPAARSARCRW